MNDKKLNKIIRVIAAIFSVLTLALIAMKLMSGIENIAWLRFGANVIFCGLFGYAAITGTSPLSFLSKANTETKS